MTDRKLVLFDLDGTLIDSEQGIVGCMQEAFRAMGEPAPPTQVLRGWIGPPLRQSFPKVVGDDADRVEEAVQHYRRCFDAGGWSEHVLYSGMDDVVRSVAATGTRLAIVTTKLRRQAVRIVADLPYGDLFEHVYGPPDDGSDCPKTQMIGQALQDFDAAPLNVTMIGDRHFDIRGAVDNDVRGIGVTWGFGSREELQDAGAAAIVDTPAQLARTLR